MYLLKYYAVRRAYCQYKDSVPHSRGLTTYIVTQSLSMLISLHYKNRLYSCNVHHLSVASLNLFLSKLSYFEHLLLADMNSKAYVVLLTKRWTMADVLELAVTGIQ